MWLCVVSGAVAALVHAAVRALGRMLENSRGSKGVIRSMQCLETSLEMRGFCCSIVCLSEQG